MSLTTTNGTLPAAGWYADPQDSTQLRWWDGSQWTAHTAPVPAPVAAAPELPAVPRYGEYVAPAVPPYGAQATAAQPYAAQSYTAQPYAAQPYSMSSEKPGVAPGTPTASWQIWGMALLPILSMLLLFTWDFEAFFRMSLENPEAAELLLLDPGYLLVTFGSWAIAAALIVFAVLDWRWLGQQGYPRRFHWAWAILGTMIYVIGRAVVVRRQAGRGLAPMWVAFAVYVLVAVVSFMWLIQMIDSVFNGMMLPPGIAS